MTESFMKLWEPWVMEPGAACSRQIGPLRLWMERRQDELRVAARRTADPCPESAGEAAGPEPMEWRRWICGEGPVQLVLEPRLPDRAVIVRPAMQVTVMSGQSVEFFVSIPVFVALRRIVGDGPGRMDVCEEPTVLLSSSWFGLPVDGALCYALKTSARRQLDELRPDVNRAFCPLTIRNDSEAALPVERICLHLQALSLYAGTRHLWTNRGALVQRADALTEVRFETTPPDRDDARIQLAAPREPARRGLMMRAFDNLKSITNF